MKESKKEILDHIRAFNNLTTDILRRRELFRAFEKNLVDKNKPEPEIKGNSFVSFYSMDYIRGQLIDLRKFFETDDLSYKISFLTSILQDETVKKSHTSLFKTWKLKFESQANKIIAHLDKDSDSLIKEVNKKDVDELIDNLNIFLDNIFTSFKKQGWDIKYEPKYRDLNGDFLRKQHVSDFEKYLKIATGEKD